MYVYFSMTENQLLALTRQYGDMDEALKNMPEVELHLNDNSVYDKKGVIESISGVIDRQTGTVVARVVFPNESRLLHSGASGTVVVPSIYKDCIAIPQTATVRMQDKTIVYKVVDGKAVSTLITVAGINDGREYVVLSGLKAGDEIVSEGAGLVREARKLNKKETDYERKYVYKEAGDGNLHFRIDSGYRAYFTLHVARGAISRYCTSDGICDCQLYRC